eukprot:TRINITY_DN6989_c0_g1_i1.p1 TRINITY_DN6989_c0_g1~~TRINITY_DN6989_c0_g1_i1.p1  ORF type:complete len:497 (+),score=120.11 TRINITY_DN6989_c0_g1_i1:134-1624(+)
MALLSLILTSCMFATLFAFVLTTINSTNKRRKLNLPDGPAPLPVGENFLVFIGDVVFNLTKLGKRYGKMFSLNFLGGNLVVINDLNILHKINKNDKFVARNDLVNEGLTKVGMFESGVIANNNLAKWKKSRGLVLKTVTSREFAENTAHVILELLDKECKTVLDPACFSEQITMKPVLERVMVELLCETLFDLNPLQDRELSLKLAKWVDDFLGAWTFFTSTLPWTWKFLPVVRKHEKCIEEFFTFENHFIDRKREEFENLSKRSEAIDRRDLIVSMFELLEDSRDGASLTREDIRAIMNDVILGGTDTTANTTSMAVYHLSRNMEVQDKLYDELTSFLASNSGEFDPRKIAKLPYLDAVVQEVMRMFPPTTLITRQAVEDVELEGYTIHQGDVVIMNLYAAYHDPKYWADPDTFNPDRFLQDTNNLPRVYGFGLGRRSCPGQLIGAMNSRLILAKLFSRYVFKAVRPDEKLQGKYQLVYSVNPKSTEVKLEQRMK